MAAEVNNIKDIFKIIFPDSLEVNAVVKEISKSGFDSTIAYVFLKNC